MIGHAACGHCMFSAQGPDARAQAQRHADATGHPVEITEISTIKPSPGLLRQEATLAWHSQILPQPEPAPHHMHWSVALNRTRCLACGAEQGSPEADAPCPG